MRSTFFRRYFRKVLPLFLSFSAPTRPSFASSEGTKLHTPSISPLGTSQSPSAASHPFVLRNLSDTFQPYHWMGRTFQQIVLVLPVPSSSTTQCRSLQSRCAPHPPMG